MIADATVAETISRIAPVDDSAALEMQRVLDGKTKPRGSLGRVEELLCRIAAIRGTSTPGALPAAVMLAAADHGIAAEGVSAYPSEVTRQMLQTFASGRAAISVLAEAAGARLVVVDAGVCEPLAHARILSRRTGNGTRNAARGPAMSETEAFEAIRAGIELAGDVAREGAGVIALGDMGIGNTTSSAALAAVLLGRDPSEVVGRGTGLGDDRLLHKIDVVRRGIAVNQADPDDPVAVLTALGGFEIAMLTGAALGAAAAGAIVVIDGFITAAAALVAVRMAPPLAGRLVAAHLSPEPGHAAVLSALGLSPLLELDLRLGEGSGAALALPLIRAALSIASDMGTFEEEGVTDAGA